MKISEDQSLKTEEEFRTAVQRALQGLKFMDTHVHDMPLCMEGFALQGLEEATVYHYLKGEVGARRRLTRQQQIDFNAMPIGKRADCVAEALFGHGELAISTASSGLFGMANALGLDTSRPYSEVLDEWRSRFSLMSAPDYRDMVFEKSCVHSMVSTQSIFQPPEARLYLDDSVMNQWDRRYNAAIRVDELLRHPDLVEEVAKMAGFDKAAGDYTSSETQAAICELLDFYIDRFQNSSDIRYISASLGPKDRFYNDDGRYSDSRFAVMMSKVILPTAKKHGLPVFLMPYVIRGLNDSAADTGDCVGHGEIDDLKAFVAENDTVRFIISGLHPSLNHDLCFLTRSCPNVRIIGFWWGNLNSNEVQRQIQERLEFLGLAWTGLNSDARITDQILYKWPDYFVDLEEVFVTKVFPRMVSNGAPVTLASIRRSIELLQCPDELFGVAA